MMWRVLGYNPRTGQDWDTTVSADEVVVNGGGLVFLTAGKLTRVVKDYRDMLLVQDIGRPVYVEPPDCTAPVPPSIGGEVIL